MGFDKFFYAKSKDFKKLSRRQKRQYFFVKIHRSKTEVSVKLRQIFKGAQSIKYIPPFIGEVYRCANALSKSF